MTTTRTREAARGGRAAGGRAGLDAEAEQRQVAPLEDTDDRGLGIADADDVGIDFSEGAVACGSDVVRPAKYSERCGADGPYMCFL